MAGPETKLRRDADKFFIDYCSLLEDLPEAECCVELVARDNKRLACSALDLAKCCPFFGTLLGQATADLKDNVAVVLLPDWDAATVEFVKEMLYFGNARLSGDEMESDGRSLMRALQVDDAQLERSQIPDEMEFKEGKIEEGGGGPGLSDLEAATDGDEAALECSMCRAEFADHDGLAAHAKAAHNSSVCLFCKGVFEDGQLAGHLEKEHASCTKEYCRSLELSVQSDEVDVSEEWECGGCYKMCVESELVSRLGQHLGENDKLRIGDTGLKEEIVKSVQHHMISCLAGIQAEILKCRPPPPPPTKLPPTKPPPKPHPAGDPEDKFKCEHCSKVFKLRMKLNVHLKKHHSDSQTTESKGEKRSSCAALDNSDQQSESSCSTSSSADNKENKSSRTCQRCQEEFPFSVLLIRHLYIKHGMSVMQQAARPADTSQAGKQKNAETCQDGKQKNAETSLAKTQKKAETSQAKKQKNANTSQARKQKNADTVTSQARKQEKVAERPAAVAGPQSKRQRRSSLTCERCCKEMATRENLRLHDCGVEEVCQETRRTVHQRNKSADCEQQQQQQQPGQEKRKRKQPAKAKGSQAKRTKQSRPTEQPSMSADTSQNSLFTSSPAEGHTSPAEGHTSPALAPTNTYDSSGSGSPAHPSQLSSNLRDNISGEQDKASSSHSCNTCHKSFKQKLHLEDHRTCKKCKKKCIDKNHRFCEACNTCYNAKERRHVQCTVLSCNRCFKSETAMTEHASMGHRWDEIY